MVLGDPEGGQRECRGAQEPDQRQEAISQIGSIFGTSDEYRDTEPQTFAQAVDH
jgi:hypothetical protein